MSDWELMLNGLSACLYPLELSFCSWISTFLGFFHSIKHVTLHQISY